MVQLATFGIAFVSLLIAIYIFLFKEKAGQGRNRVRTWIGVACILLAVGLGLAGLLEVGGVIQTTPAAPQYSLPTGYLSFGHFVNQKAFDADWWLEDKHKLCTITLKQGQVAFACTNSDPNADLTAALHNRQAVTTLKGAAVIVKLEKDGGAFHLTTAWRCQAHPTTGWSCFGR